MRILAVCLSLLGLVLLNVSPALGADAAAEAKPAKVKILLLVGGHGYDTKNFPALFAQDDLEVTQKDISKPAGADVFDDISAFPYDAIVLYSLTQKITPKQQANFLALLDKGVGVIAFHHNLGSFQAWPEYQKIAGAKFLMAKTKDHPGSGWKEGVEMKLHIEDAAHPITAGLSDFTIHDEVYNKQVFEPDNHVLVTCDNPLSDKPIVWVRQYRKSRVCGIQAGHGAGAYLNKSFQKLLHQAILWTVNRSPAGAKGAAGEAGTPLLPALKAAAAYKFGDSRLVLVEAAKAIRAPGADQVAARRELVGLLHASIGAEARRWAFEQLALIGTALEVPSLAGFLGDKDMNMHARAALEAMPMPEALAALRDGLDRLQGDLLVGVINSLANRGDAQACDKVAALVASSDPAVAHAATAALGKIAPTVPDALAQAAKKPELAAEAADSMLRIAERMLAAGQAGQAAKVYEPLTGAAASHVCSAALAGLIRSAPAAGLGRLGECLVSDVATRRQAALAVLGQLPADQAGAVFEDQIPKLSPTAQVLVLDVLAGRGDVKAPKAVLAAAGSADAMVRQAALRAIGRAGDETAVPVLLKAVTGADAPQAQAAKASLLALSGLKVNPAIVEAMQAAAPALHIELIRVLVARNAGQAGEALLADTKHADAGVRAEALLALGKLTDEKALPALVKLLAEANEDAVRQAAAKAVETVAGRIADPDQRVAPLLGAMAGASPASQVALLKVLARLGGPKALQAVRAAAQNTDAAVQDAAIRSLADWPDASAAGDMLALAKTSPNETYRVLALRALLRVIALPSDRTTDQTLALYQDALSAARRAEDKKLVLAGLGSILHPRALEMAVACAGEPGLAKEAATTAFKLAEALFSVDSNAVKASMERLAGSGDADVVRQAKAFIASAANGVRVAANLAPLGKATSPDGLEPDGQSGPDQAAIDGKPATYWDEEDGKSLYRLVVTFGEAHPMSAISIMGFQQHNYAPKDFDILCDGKVVKAVKDAQYQENILIVNFPLVTARSLELKITGYYGQSPGIRELGIYGTAETRTPELQLKKMTRRQLESGAFVAIPR